MMTRFFLTMLAALVLLVGSVAPTMAATDDLADEALVAGTSPAGYYIWRYGRNYFLRTHGPGDEHHFVAYLTTDGRFRDIEAVRLESHEGVAIINQGRTLVVNFWTYDFTDGVNFRVEGGSRLRFDLWLNSERIATDQIYLGAGGWHPAANPFSVAL